MMASGWRAWNSSSTNTLASIRWLLPCPEKVASKQARAAIARLVRNYERPTDFFVEKLAEGVRTIAAAFYPKPVIVRLSDFKTNEYACLLGGAGFEPEEENPMLGFRARRATPTQPTPPASLSNAQHSLACATRSG